MTIVAVCGLKREARIIEGTGVTVVIGGGDGVALQQRLARAIRNGADGIISMGIAGALSPTLKAGDGVIASHVIAGDAIFQTDAVWLGRLATRLPDAVVGAVAGVDRPIADTAAKAALNRANGSCAVDMESHIAARAALAHGLPFAALRIISDAAEQVLPPAALVAMRSDGGINYGAVLRSLLTRPQQIPALIQTARDSEKAFAALLRCRNALGAHLGGLDLG